jgi:hypothetical protein
VVAVADPPDVVTVIVLADAVVDAHEALADVKLKTVNTSEVLAVTTVPVNEKSSANAVLAQAPPEAAAMEITFVAGETPGVTMVMACGDELHALLGSTEAVAEPNVQIVFTVVIEYPFWPWLAVGVKLNEVAIANPAIRAATMAPVTRYTVLCGTRELIEIPPRWTASEVSIGH